MAASTRRDLFVNIGGSASELGNATKAGRTALLELNQAAGSIVDQIGENMRKLGNAANAPLAELERNFKSSLGNIRNELRSLQSSGDSGAALKFFDQNSVNQQIAQAERLSAQYRLIAEAAQEVARGGGANAEAAKVWAASYGTLAAQTELETQKLREQAGAQTEVLGKMGAVTKASGTLTAVSGAQRAGFQQLAYNINDVTTMYGLHASAQQIFVSQSGQVLQSLLLVTQGGAGWLATVGQFGPVILIAISLLTPFIAALLKSNDALKEGVDKLKKDADETEKSRLAKVAYNNTLEGQIALQRQLNEELDRSIRTQRQIQQNTLRDSQVRLDNFQGSRPAAAKAVTDQEGLIRRYKETIAAGQDPDGATAQLVGVAEAKLTELRTKLTQLDADIAKTQRAIRNAQVPLIQDDVEAQFDKKAAAVRAYTIALGNLNQQLAIGAGKKETRDFYLPDGSFEKRSVTGISAAEYARQFKIIGEQRKAAEKAARDAEKVAPTGSPSSALLSSAESYRGASEAGTGRDTLLSLFKSANISIDPKMVAWCAAFVNAVLATNGLPGTGSLSAKSFLDYGAKTDAPQKGDIVVSKRDGGGHVGFFEGFDKSGNVRVLGGNTGDKVGEQTIKRSDVLGFRRAPASGQSAEDVAAKAAQKEAERRAGFERELGDETAKAISLSRELTAADDDRLDVKLATIAAEKDNRDNALDNLVTTGKLKQVEADQLKAVNARIADEKASIATNRSINETRRKVLQADQAEFQAKASVLNLQGELATTNKQRLKIARELLELELKQRRAAAEAKSASHDPTEAAEGLRDLASVNAEAPLRRAQVDKQYASPIARYRDELKAATDDMDEALEGVAVHGLQSLEDGLLGVINGTKSVGQAFKEMALSIIADLARIAIEKAIVGTISKVFGFSEGHVGGPGGTAVHGFASGIISGPGTGTSDSIPGWMAGVGPIYVSNGESIMTAEATRQFGPILKAMNDNSIRGFAAGDVPSFPPLPSPKSLGGAQRGGDVHQHFDLRGALVTEDVMKKVDQIASARAAEGAEFAINHTNDTLRQMQRSRL